MWFVVMVVGVVLGWLTAGDAWAHDADLLVSQYQHTAWLARDGAPSPIHAVAQTDDGTLWLGSEEGLVRFDGQSFTSVRTTEGPGRQAAYAYALSAEPGGGLWIGFRRGDGLGYLKDGKLTRFELKGDVEFLSADGRGGAWLQLGYRLYHAQGRAVEAIGTGWNLPERIFAVVVARDGAVWVNDADSRLHYLPPGGKAFVDVGLFETSELVRGPGGSLWGAASHGVWSVDVEDGHPRKVKHGPVTLDFGTMMFDRDGGAWVQRTGGLSRESDPSRMLDDRALHGPASAIFSVQQGLSSETIFAIVEDRAGNVWLGTSKGLDRFRRTPLTPVKLPRRALSFAMAPAEGGALWAANWQGGLMKVSDSGLEEFPSVGPGIRFIHRDPRGSIWVGGGKGLWRSDDGVAFQPVPIDADFMKDAIRAMSVDAAGDVWITGGSASQTGHVVGGRWADVSKTLPTADGFPPQWSARCLTGDALGRTWGCAGDDVVLIEQRKARLLSAIAPGLDVGRVIAIQVHGAHVWIGGYTGVAVFDGRRVRNLKRRDGLPFDNIGGIVELGNGEVWLHDRTHALRIPAASAKHAVDGTDAAVDVEVLGEPDGMAGAVNMTSPLPSLVQGGDGRLWFASDAGLAWIDPATYRRPARVPPVHVRSLLADGKDYPVDAAPLLAARNKRVEIAYSATALSTPERVKFRYRLEGVDGDWQDVGNRRIAYFNGLGPGDYQFRVESTDEYGDWSGGQEAAIRFSVAAAWYQTIAFRLACVAGALAALWALVKLRERQVAAQVMAREEARQVERNRIARDLHDTLLQSVQGLMWRFEAVSARIPGEDPLRGQLEQALALANRVVGEGRDRVKGLRQAAGARRLPEQLRDAWSELCGGDARRLVVTEHGDPAALREDAREEVFQILREAIVNACRHASASRVSVDLRYRDDRSFEATVVDDGVGIAPEVLERGRAGHWGLSGMRERAEGLGARFSVRSELGVGTTVELALDDKALSVAA